MKKSTSFAQGAFILMIASAVSKVIGAVFKIPLTNMIGADGMGVFGIAYTIYTTLFVISTAGLPVAISKMVAEANARGDHFRVRSVLRVSLLTFSIVGVAASVLMFVFANQFTQLVRNSMAYYAVVAISPSLFFVSIVSIIRGYFQGLSDMVPTAMSQVIESIGKLAFGIVFAYILLDAGYPVEIAAAGAIFGVTLGMALSAIYLIICQFNNLRKMPKGVSTHKNTGLLRELVRTAIPVTIGSAVLSLTNLIDMLLVMSRLQEAAGCTEAVANRLYGAYNMSIALFNLPQTFVVAIAVSVIPAISAYMVNNNRVKAGATIASALRISGILALPAGVGLFVLAKPIMSLLYFNKPEDVAIAAPLMTYLGIAVIFVALVSVTNSSLQAIGKVNVPVVTMLIGGVVKITANYVLVGNPEININGAPIGTILCYATIAILNLIVLKTQFKLSATKLFAKPLAAAVVMGLFAWLLMPIAAGLIGQRVGVVLVIGFSVLMYIVVLLASGGLPKEDILLLPKGEKLAKFVKY